MNTKPYSDFMKFSDSVGKLKQLTDYLKNNAHLRERLRDEWADVKRCREYAYRHIEETVKMKKAEKEWGGAECSSWADVNKTWDDVKKRIFAQKRGLDIKNDITDLCKVKIYENN
jgi:hypothetical protein